MESWAVLPSVEPEELVAAASQTRRWKQLSILGKNPLKIFNKQGKLVAYKKWDLTRGSRLVVDEKYWCHLIYDNGLQAIDAVCKRWVMCIWMKLIPWLGVTLGIKSKAVKGEWLEK